MRALLRLGVVLVLLAVAASGPVAAQPSTNGKDGGEITSQPSSHRGSTAAAVTYRQTPRPEEVPDDYQAPPGARLRFYDITAIDGFVVKSALFEPRRSDPEDTTMVISVHGSGGTYLSNTPRILAPALPAHGYATLAITTRQGGDAVNTDNFYDIRKDLEAAVLMAKDLGYHSIVLHGQSLGNIHVQFYVATNWDPDIKGVVLTAMFGDLPAKSRTMLIQNEENYRALFDESIQALADGTLDQELPTQMGWIGDRTVPVTGQHFLTYRWDRAPGASGVYWIKRVPRPILMVRDENDLTVRDFEPYQLLAEATAAGSLVPSIEYVLLPKAGDRNGHGFPDNQQALIDTVLAWLDDQGL